LKIYKIKKVIVPIDFSAISLHAISHAVNLAKLSNARITLLHVVKPYVDAFGTSGMLAMAGQIEKKMQGKNMLRLRKLAATIRKQWGLEVKYASVIGPVAETIKKTAEKNKADLIVMGTHGASGFVENWIGSNTYHVATLSAIPVMSVHKRLNTRGYRDIIFPVREKALAKYAYALTFSKLYNSRIHIIGFIREDENLHETSVRRISDILKKRFNSNNIHVKLSFTYDSRIAEFTIRYAKKYGDSLVISGQDQDFHLAEIFSGTFTKNVLHKMLSPVLTISG